MAETKNGATRLYLYLSIAAAFLFFIAPIAGGSYWISNLENRVRTLEQASPQSENTASAVRALQLAQGSNCQQFAKIETQFGTTETIINETHVADLRAFSMLWQKSFAMQPAQIYYEIKIPHEVVPCT